MRRRPRARASGRCTRRSAAAAPARSHRGRSTRARRASSGPTRVEHLDRRAAHELVEAGADHASATPRAPRRNPGETLVQRRVRRRRRRHRERRRRSRGTTSVSSVRRPRERREVAEDRRDVAVGEEHHRDPTNTSAKPTAATTERGRKRARAGRARRRAASSRAGGGGTPTRAKNHGFCSWTRNAAPETASPTGAASRHQRFVSLPCASASSAPPIDHQRLRPRAVGDHVDRRVGVEGHHRPHEHADREDERRARGRCASGAARQTSSPTSASASMISPKSRKPVANSQCTISALRLHRASSRSASSGRATTNAKNEPDGDDEQRRLDEEPPEALAARVQAA